MPLQRRDTVNAGEVYPLPFVGPHDHTAAIAVAITALTSAEIDADGYLKPGVPLNDAGALIAAASGNYVYGVTIEPIKVADGNTAADIAAAGTQDVALAVIGMVNRAVAEDILGRAYTADEVAGFTTAGSLLRLLE